MKLRFGGTPEGEHIGDISLQFLRKNCYSNAAIGHRRQQSTPVVAVRDTCHSNYTTSDLICLSRSADYSVLTNEWVWLQSFILVVYVNHFK